MAFYKVTYNEHHGFATVHNYGCTFRCPTCSYKLRSGPEGKPGLAHPRPGLYLRMAEIKAALRTQAIASTRFRAVSRETRKTFRPEPRPGARSRRSTTTTAASRLTAVPSPAS